MVGEENNDGLDGHSSDLDKDMKQGEEEESDSETTMDDSASSQGDPRAAQDEKIGTSRVPKRVSKKDASHSSARASSVKTEPKTKPQIKSSQNNPKKAVKFNKQTPKDTSNNNSKPLEVPSKSSSESSEGVDDKALEEEKEVEVHILDEASNGAQATDDERAEDQSELEDRTVLDQKIEEMETRIEKLEEELREVAALEISLYSVIPEHGSSSHKVHTPARRLSRLYIHACKHWNQDKRATVAKNTVSGLVLIAKSCGNDVPRLTFWLSNIVVLREIIFHVFGNLCHLSPVTRLTESYGNEKRADGKSLTLKWRGSPGTKQVHGPDFMHSADDWQETRTLTAALEKVEAWIFSRIVESVWWQTLTPNMQSPVEGLNTNRTSGRLSGPALGDQHQGSFSISLWRNAFQDAFQRLCPVRAGGHECGCLPVLARLVMEQCVTRLDVAMFNAILRESAHEIPTDPVSDPIVDSKVLPIPAGDLSFGSGAQLKNSVGNWSRWLSDLLGMDADDYFKEDQHSSEESRQGGNNEPKSFHLLNALSDLLMLPKDMLIDRSIRKEVCPSIGLTVIKRILCNFTPDEFCPDPVPGAVLEALNAEGIVERRISGDSASGFPCTAAPVVYAPPSSADVAEKVAEAGGKSQLARNVSIVQRRGYTSDEDLEELDSPLTSVINGLPASPSTITNGNGRHQEQDGYPGMNIRYELLREVWSM